MISDLSRDKRGMGLIVALAVCMVCLLVATAMIALARQSLLLSTSQSLTSQSYFLARGQVQETVALLETGAIALDQYTEESPRSVEVERVQVYAWVKQDAEHTNVYHVFARAQGQLSESLIVLKPESGGAAYGSLYKNIPNGLDLGGGPQKFFMQSGTDEWSGIPDPPEFVYQGGSATPTQIARTHISPSYIADNEGHLIVSNVSTNPKGTALFRYDPVARTWQDLGPVPGAEWTGGGDPTITQRATEHELNWTVTGSGSEMYGCLGPTDSPGPGESRSVIHKLDLQSGVWSAVRGPQDQPVRSIAGGNEGGLVASIADSDMNPTNQVAVLSGSEWMSLPDAPFEVSEIAVGPEGEIYIHGGTIGENASVAKYDTEAQTWAVQSTPPGTPVRRHTRAISVDSDGALICLKAPAVDGIAYSRLEDGVWTDIPALPVSGTDLDPWAIIGSGGGSGDDTTLEQTVSR